MANKNSKSLGILQANLERTTRNLNNAKDNLNWAKRKVDRAQIAYDKVRKEIHDTFETVIGVNR